MNRSNPFSPNNSPVGGPGAPPPSGTPDTQWASVFQDASEAPPARAWSGIERQLDLDDEDGVLPLYPQGLSRPALFGRWLAGVATACLVALFGWWTLRPNPATLTVTSPVSMTKATTQPAQKGALDGPTALSEIESKQSTRQKKAVQPSYAWVRPPKKSQPTQPAQADGTLSDEQTGETVAIEMAPGTLVQSPATVNVTVTQSVEMTTQAQPMARSMGTAEPTVHSFTQVRSSFFAQSSPAQPKGMSASGGTLLPPATPTTLPILAQVGKIAVSMSSPAGNDLPVTPAGGSGERPLLPVQPMTIRPFAAQTVGNECIVWFSPEQSEATPAQKTAHKSRQKAWISAGMVASSFNPTMALRAVSGLAYTNNSLTPTVVASGPVPALALDSRAGQAITVQANVGIPLSDRWALETGVGYLTGQSTVQSPVRTTSIPVTITNTGMTTGATLYTDLIGGSTGNSAAYDMSNQYTSASQRAALVANSSYDRSVSQAINNSYQFVQVPVQLSYELRPRRKFGLALLTGMVSNLFVRNTVADALTVKAQDGVYKPLTLAGTAGMRLRFRPDKQWSASMAGVFQQSFQSITRADVGVQAVPQSMGVSVSVDRQF